MKLNVQRRGAVMPDKPLDLSSDEPVAAPASDPVVNPMLVIHEALQGLQYGQVTIIVQDGVVVQIERTEKRRLRSKP